MSKAVWTTTTTQLPADGQAVVVKTAPDTLEHRMTFRADPEPRWEGRDFIAEFHLYKYWRPLPPERRRTADDAHGAHAEA
jgi:hypothetical protein